MKNKPQVHFWNEVVCAHDPELAGSSVIAINCCRAWDVPANGVFMLFIGREIIGWDRKMAARDLVLKKLEARERALVNFYGREAKRHLDQIELTPGERRDRAAARAPKHEF